MDRYFADVCCLFLSMPTCNIDWKIPGIYFHPSFSSSSSSYFLPAFPPPPSSCSFSNSSCVPFSPHDSPELTKSVKSGSLDRLIGCSPHFISIPAAHLSCLCFSHFSE